MNSTQQFLKYIMRSEEEAALNYLYEQGDYVDVNSVSRVRPARNTTSTYYLPSHSRLACLGG